MEKPRVCVAVIMQRRALNNRWQSEAWEPFGVLPNYAGASEPRKIVEQEGVTQWLYPGQEILLHRDEAEGYYLNVSTAEPRVFVSWRLDEGRAAPLLLTVSYHEASRWLDGGEQVDSVPMPPEIYGWVGEWVEKNYRPEPNKRIRPRSFMHPRDRARN
ncbi:MAG: DUF3305 domain-containing protein [Betaproteobacteria bacterium]|nr:DUF3305 domain-containing protein [Betaproteobacteria bacterium]